MCAKLSDATSTTDRNVMDEHRFAPRWLMIVADFVVVLVFVAIGRRVHDHGVRLSGLISTTWPFAIGLAAGWGIVITRRRDGGSLGAGVTVAVATTVTGMIVRVLAGQGTAVAFIVVTLGFLGATMLGWRLLGGARRRAH